jgi:tellurite resistance protein
MIRELKSKTLLRLRDELLVVGKGKARQEELGDAHPMEGDEEAKSFFDAVAEAMFLMIASDGKIDDAERDVFRGALRELTEGWTSDQVIEGFLERFELAADEQGAKARLQATCAVLQQRVEAAEAAFILAAAIAFADNEIADEENDTMNELAELLNITEARANELLDELEQAQAAADSSASP